MQPSNSVDTIEPNSSYIEFEYPEYGTGSAYCTQILKDASRLLSSYSGTWNDEAGCCEYAGFSHYLMPSEPDTAELAQLSACYMLRLPIVVGDDPWAIYLLELNVGLVSETGFSLAVDAENGLVLIKQLAGEHLNPIILAHVIESGCDVVDTVLRSQLYESNEQA